MTIGEKIKKLRTDKLMSQSELAGSEITRNMLSQIEHGSANPSLSTVTYIASRLNVSPSFLLANEEDEKLFLKNAAVSDIKKAYKSKNFALCYQMCKNFQSVDDEITLILAECSLRVGIEEFCKGNLHSSIEYLDEALSYCNESIYDTEAIIAEALSYFNYMELVSPLLASSLLDDAESKIFLMKDPFCVYSGIIYDLETLSLSDVKYLEERIAVLDAEDSYALHVSARMAMNRKQYTIAHDLLHNLLYREDYDLPEPMMYFVLCDIEICCKEIDDFKGAYEYSASKLALLQKLLA